MISVPASTKIWLATSVTDTLKGFNGLAVLAEKLLKPDAYRGPLFVFGGRQGLRFLALSRHMSGDRTAGRGGLAMNLTPNSHADARVFISYSRKDREIAEPLRDALIGAGFEAFLDLNEIKPGEPWEQRLGVLVASAEKIVFLISPDSVTSQYCAWEVDEAERQGKGILPVLVRDTHHGAIPGRLTRLQFIDYRTDEARSTGLNELFKALSIDLVWEREKTRVNDLSETWEKAGRPRSLLTWREDAIRALERWRDVHPATSAAPTEAQLAYISESRLRFSRRQRWIRGGLATGLTMMTALAIAAVFFGLQSEGRRIEAERQAQAARLAQQDAESARKEAVEALAASEANILSALKLNDEVLKAYFGYGGSPPDQSVADLILCEPLPSPKPRMFLDKMREGITLMDPKGINSPLAKLALLEVSLELVSAYRAVEAKPEEYSGILKWVLVNLSVHEPDPRRGMMHEMLVKKAIRLWREARLDWSEEGVSSASTWKVIDGILENATGNSDWTC